MEIETGETSKPAKQRGRPRSFDRDQAVVTALGLFKKQGYEGTSISDLTAGIGIAPVSLYSAFGSKEDLFEEAVELYQRTEGEFAARCLRHESAFEGIRSLMMTAAKEYASNGGCFVSLGLLSSGEGHAPLAARMAVRRINARDAIRDTLKRGMADGELAPATDCDALAGFYAALLQGMSVQARDGATVEALEGIAEAALIPLQQTRS